MGVGADIWSDETTPPRFRTPTPSQKITPQARPATHTLGKKRMVIGTPAPDKQWRPRAGDRTWSSVTEVVAVVAAMEARLNAKFAALAMAGEAAEKAIGEKVAAADNAPMAALTPALARLRRQKGKRKETVAAEKREAEKVAADMAAMKKRWREGDFGSEEWEVYIYTGAQRLHM